MAEHRRTGIARASIGVLSGAFTLAPVIVIALLTTAAIIFAALFLSLSIMVVVVSLVVLATSVIVYTRTQKYGDAAFAFVGGMLTAFAVPWTTGSFVAFLAVWIGFNLLTFLISALRLTRDLEVIYTHAAGIRGGDKATVQSLAKRLHSIGDADTNIGLLSTIDRARVVRQLWFRQIDFDDIPGALAQIGVVQAATRVDHIRVTNFVADLLKLGNLEALHGRTLDMQGVFSFMEHSAVAPNDVFAAFEKSRSLVLSGRIGVSQYFEKLKKALLNGISPDEMKDELMRSDK